jgi:hypothetical protein
LAAALLQHARNYDVSQIVPTPFGRNFVVEGALPSPDGRLPQVRAVWFIANEQETVTLATAIRWMSDAIIAVVTLRSDQIRPIAKDEIAHARQVASIT